MVSLPPVVCTGDCDDDKRVTVNELVMSINIALGMLPPGECDSLDAHSNGRVTIDELIAAVNNALNGCR